MSRTVIGLVGGIASGKSTVAALFAGLRPTTIVDADRIAGRVLERADVRRAVARRFPGAAGRDGSLDREKLARAAFGDPKALKALEAITHPPIRRAMERAAKRAKTRYVVVDAPLLQETGADAMCDAVVYVRCPARTRRARAVRERGWTEAEHRRREARQWPLARKRARSDFTVDNGSTPAVARRDVRRVLRRLEGK